MDEDNKKTLADLTTLIDISRQLGSPIALEPMLRSVEQAALKLLDCERVSIFLYDREKYELYSKVATGVDAIRFPADRGIAGEAAESRQPINVDDAYSDERFNAAVDNCTGFRTRNLLSLAMDDYGGRLVGVLQFLNKRSGSFTAHDERLAHTFSALAGVAIQRQLLLEEAALRQKLQRDLDLAQRIQRDYLPQQDPEISGYDIAGWNRPADQTGGDAYDFIPMGEQQVPMGEQRLGLLIADATGHGIGPALMVAECRALVRALASITDDLGKIITEANAVLVNDLTEGRFITACFAVLDAGQNTVRFCSAGHAPLLHYEAAADRFVEIAATTMPMGIIDDLQCEAPSPLTLQPGDMFILVTDGFYEWRRPDGEQFGLQRLFEVVQSHRDRTCAQIIRALYESVVRFGAGTPQSDDLTTIMVKRTE